MSDNNYTLTKVLVGTLKWSGKQSFIFFILSLLMIGGTITAANPVMDDYNVQANKETVLTEKWMDNNPTQIGITVFDNTAKVTVTIYKVDGSDLEIVFQMTGHEFLEERTFASGNYRFVATSDRDTSLLFGQSQVNHGALALIAIFLTIFAIAQGVFWCVFPFAIFILIVNALTGSDASKEYQVSKKQQNQWQTDMKTSTKVYRREPAMKRAVKPFFSSNTILNKLTNQEWGWLTLAFFFFIMMFVEPNGPFFVFTVIIAVSVFYAVTEREKMKDRLVVLLNHYPETSVDFLSQQMGKKSKDVIKVLQIMILDEAYPIQLNLNNYRVSKVGDLSQVDAPIQTPVQTVHQQSTPQPVQNISAQEYTYEPETKEEVAEVPAKPVVEEKSEGIYCTGCGENLISKVAYCYNCGQRI